MTREAAGLSAGRCPGARPVAVAESAAARARAAAGVGPTGRAGRDGAASATDDVRREFQAWRADQGPGQGKSAKSARLGSHLGAFLGDSDSVILAKVQVPTKVGITL